MGNRFRDKEVEEGLEEPREQEPQVPLDEPTPEDEQPRPAPAPPSRKQRRADRAARGIGNILGAEVLTRRSVVRQLPLLLLCLFYLLLIVGNRYHVEALSREKANTEERIVYLREHRIQMQKQYQQSVKISQMAEDLRPTGVGITSGPPYEIEK